jgi:hypothetical protein
MSTPPLSSLRKVTYLHERPNHGSVLEIPSTVLLAKSKEWKYEQEWRMLQPLEDSVEVRSVPSGTIYLFSIPPSCIKGVILGHLV